jgi:hypothetical protein
MPIGDGQTTDRRISCDGRDQRLSPYVTALLEACDLIADYALPVDGEFAAA